MMSDKRVTAVVPALNEKERIGGVISALLQARLINEVIVIDDGSTDGTADFVAKNFPAVKLIVNEKNRGKAYSMNLGVEKASNDVIFFCDADLSDFTGEIADEIARPVLEDEYDMYIGIRNNKMQKVFTPFGINSGERAIRRELWEKLPAFYKNRFRIEVGLNYMVRYCTKKGMGYRVMPYYQTLKEKKYGFWKGEINRFGMNNDVIIGWFRAVWDFYICRNSFRKKLYPERVS